MTIPEKPVLHDPTRTVEVEGKEYVMFSRDDWQNIRVWYLSLERELKTACLALGNTKKQCVITP